MADAKRVFEHIYHAALWPSQESRSGYGSELKATEHIRREFSLLLRDLDVSFLVDAGCGDFNWMRMVDLTGISYHGLDVVDGLIEENRKKYAAPNRSFSACNIICDPIPKADLILCKDCLFHLPHADILKTLANFKKSGSRYLLTTHYSWRGVPNNADIELGQWRRLNLEQPPFNFPPPVRSIVEGSNQWQGTDRTLALWPLDALSSG